MCERHSPGAEIAGPRAARLASRRPRLPAKPRSAVAPFASPAVAVLLGLGLVLGGHVEQALLDLWFVGDLSEPPTLGGHLTKIISAISH